MRIFSLFISFLIFFCSAADSVSANEAMLQSIQKNMQELQKTVQTLQTTVASQNEIIERQTIRINALEDSKVAAQAGQTTVALPGADKPLAGISQGFNPEIGVVGSAQMKLTESTEDGEGNDTISLKELELSFAQVVDPYSRLDAIIALNDNLEEQNVDIEEAYYTHWGLPFGFRGQVGKFRSKIGKQNLQHLHQLPTTDYAMVIEDFFGEEGLSSSGVRLQNDIPNPWDIPVELTGEVLRGNNGNSFSGVSRRPIFNTHLKTYFEPMEETGLELGWTTLFGDENPPRTVLLDDGTGTETLVETPVTDPKGTGRYGVKVFGADATFTKYLPEGKTLKWQNEIYFQNRSSLVHANSDPWGFYTLLDYRFSPRFSTGLRFDYLEPLGVADQHHHASKISPYLIFWQSEFASLKLQYSHLEPAGADAKSDNMIFLQVDFLIGAHKHPVQ